MPRSTGWTLRSNNGKALPVDKKHPRVSGCSVPDAVEQKSAFQLMVPREVYPYAVDPSDLDAHPPPLLESLRVAREG